MMNRIKILYLLTKKDVGGAQKYVADLAENLDKNKFDTKVLTGGKNGARFLSNGFYPYFLFINDIVAIIELFFIFRKEKPDIVHLNSSKAGVIGALAGKLAGVPKIVFTAHGWVFGPDNKLSFLRRKFYILLHKIAAKYQDKIINVSEYDRQLALKHKIAPHEKLFTVYNGISDISFLNKQESRKALSKAANYNLSASGPMTDIWVGSVGRLVVEKDQGTFIKAAALINNLAVKFFVIGSGPEKKYLQSLIASNQLRNKFYILEDITPAAPYLKALDLFVLSSIKEGLPYTMLEAMAAKLPIVVTRVGGMPEIINGRGLVMPPKEPEELARAISHFLQNKEEAQKAATEANKFLNENLTLERMIKETEKIYLL